LVLVAAICVGVFAGDKLLLSPMIELWKDRSEQIAELKTQISSGLDLVDREERIKQRWEDMKERALPTDVSVAEKQVLQSLDDWTRKSRLGKVSLKPNWIEDEDEPVRRFECRVTNAEGDMAALARFLYELECNPLALHVEEVEITSGNDGVRNLNLDVRFSGLVFTGEER
jgi:hypothetical protein